MPATPTARSVWPVRQARPAVSVMMTATLRPSVVVHPLAQCARRGVRVLGQEYDVPGSDVRGVHAGRGHHDAEPVLHDRRRAPACDHAHRLVADGGRAVTRPHPALGLAHDLAGDQDDVAVVQVQPTRATSPRSVPSATSPMPPTAQTSMCSAAVLGPRHFGVRHRARSIAAATRSAVASWSVIHSGTARQRMPAASIRSTDASSTVSTSQPSSTPPACRAP